MGLARLGWGGGRRPCTTVTVLRCQGRLARRLEPDEVEGREPLACVCLVSFC